MDIRSLSAKVFRGLLIYLGACLLFFGALAIWPVIGVRIPSFYLFGVPNYGQGLVAGAVVALVFGLIKRPRFGNRITWAVALTFALVVAWLTPAPPDYPGSILPQVLIVAFWGPFLGGIAGSVASWLIGLVVSRAAKKSADK